MYVIPSQKYVSFDLFDTLIYRDVSKPSDIFMYVEKCCKLNNIDCTKDFYNKRKEAEIEANRECGGNASIKDIYRRLEITNCMDLSKVLDTELLLEYEYCKPNKEMLDFYYQCISANKTVLLISDMYIPENEMVKILSHCGIKDFKKLYISCDKKASKSSGNLFQYVLNDLNICKKDLVHYGDNIRSDFIKPCSIGIKAHHYVRRIKEETNPYYYLLNHEERIDYDTILSVLKNDSGQSQFQKWGMSAFGPLLVGFSKWLSRNVLQDGISSIFFLSRDGYMMKKAYDMLNNQRTKTNYLFCSRRSFSVPLLWKCNHFNELFNYINMPQNISVKSFVHRLGISTNMVKQELLKFNLDESYIFYNHALEKDSKIEEFFESIKDVVHRNSRKGFYAIKEYLLNLEFNGRVAVVDIGYHGTMQNSLIKLLKELGVNCEVIGYYMGVTDSNC